MLLVDDGTNNSITYSTENGAEIPNPLNLPSGEYEFALSQYEKYLFPGDTDTLIQLSATDIVKFIDVKFTVKVETDKGGLIKYYESGSYLTKTSGYEDLVFEDQNISFETPDQQIYGSYYIWNFSGSDLSEWKIKKLNSNETRVTYNRRCYYVVENDDNKAIFTGYLKYDESPPAAPTNLQITESQNEHPLLSWTANTEPDIDEYNVYRKGGYPFVDWTAIGTTTSTTYEDFELTTTYLHGEDYFYKITAVDVNNNESDYSNTVEVDARLEKQNIIENLELKPKEYALNSNYPNPFNPTTKISYQLPKSSSVTLKVYDLLGKEVAELVNENKGA